MNLGLINAVLLAWPPIVVILFRAIGPRLAVLVGMLVGYLLLPEGRHPIGPTGFTLAVHRIPLTGLSLLLGALIFDHRTLFRWRPGWVDLPMAGYYLAPLIGLATGLPGSSADVLDVMIDRGLGWVVPYVMGRIYFGRGDGPASVAVALTIAGLAYIPICLYEEVAGPSRYLAGLVYGLTYREGMVDRLGGWRPEGFIGNGLDLAAWMALTAVMATWLALEGRRIGRWPAWPAALALILTSLSCRGVYGYLTLAIGLFAALTTRWLRTRAVLVALLVVPLLYMGLRLSGAWSGEILIRAAAATGRSGTVDWRLKAEDHVVRRVLEYNPAVGFGTYIWHAEGLSPWPDGGWLHALWIGGFLGLALQLTSLYALPAILGLGKPSGRPNGREAASPTWGLACWCILVMISILHNADKMPATALIAGTLVGSASSRTVEPSRPRPTDRARVARPRRWPVPLIVSIIVLVCLEFLGRLPRSTDQPPASPAPTDAPAKTPP